MKVDLELLAVELAEAQLDRGAWRKQPGRRTYRGVLGISTMRAERLREVVNGKEPCRPAPRPCLAGNCSRPVERYGYCNLHGWRVRVGIDVEDDQFPTYREGFLSNCAEPLHFLGTRTSFRVAKMSKKPPTR